MKKFGSFALGIVGVYAIYWLFTHMISALVVAGTITTDDNMGTLFQTLSKINVGLVISAFVLFGLVAILLDLLSAMVIGIWNWYVKHHGDRKYSLRYEIFHRYWQRYRSVHIIAFLLTLFFTLSVTVPSSVMNSFTAIVSISTLVISLSKRN